MANGKVEMLFIHPDNRGSGIGKELLLYTVEKLNATKVDVNEQNQQAVGFYQRMGFVTSARPELAPMGKPYPVLHMELQNKNCKDKTGNAN